MTLGFLVPVPALALTYTYSIRSLDKLRTESEHSQEVYENTIVERDAQFLELENEIKGLKEDEDLHESITRGVREGVYISQGERIVFANNALEQFTAMSAEELEGIRVSGHYTP